MRGGIPGGGTLAFWLARSNEETASLTYKINTINVVEINVIFAQPLLKVCEFSGKYLKVYLSNRHNVNNGNACEVPLFR